METRAEYHVSAVNAKKNSKIVCQYADADHGDQVTVDPVSIMDTNEPLWTTAPCQLPPSVPTQEGRFDNNVPKRLNETA